MTLESHHLFFDTHKSWTLLVDQLLHINSFGLSRSVRPTNGLEFCRRIPRRCCDIDPCRFLEIETLTTTLDLDDEDSSMCSLLETLNLFDALLLGYGTINSKRGTERRKLLLDVVHLTPKLAENEGLFIGMGLDHLE